jgi:hypothetical protein
MRAQQARGDLDVRQRDAVCQLRCWLGSPHFIGRASAEFISGCALGGDFFRGLHEVVQSSAKPLGQFVGVRDPSLK